MTFGYEKEMPVGARFGNLVVFAVEPGRKNTPPKIHCVCNCGAERTARPAALRSGRVSCCARCALKRAWRSRARNTAEDRRLSAKESEYRCNAKGKGLRFALSRAEFRATFSGSCRYCGATPAEGIDRIDNSKGYAPGNISPCCMTCNFSKRTLSHDAFLSHVEKMYRHLFGVSQ